MNGGNLLCSQRTPDTEWSLDGIIDWESAAVADPRSLSGSEPWRTTRSLALVTKGVLLAEAFVRGTLPRCELHQLLEGYDRASRQLDEDGWLKYEAWALRVERCRTEVGDVWKRSKIGPDWLAAQ